MAVTLKKKPFYRKGLIAGGIGNLDPTRPEYDVYSNGRRIGTGGVTYDYTSTSRKSEYEAWFEPGRITSMLVRELFGRKFRAGSVNLPPPPRTGLKSVEEGERHIIRMAEEWLRRQ